MWVIMLAVECVMGGWLGGEWEVKWGAEKNMGHGSCIWFGICWLVDWLLLLRKLMMLNLKSVDLVVGGGGWKRRTPIAARCGDNCWRVSWLI